jgi:hypothetical protein
VPGTVLECVPGTVLECDKSRWRTELWNAVKPDAMGGRALTWEELGDRLATSLAMLAFAQGRAKR